MSALPFHLRNGTLAAAGVAAAVLFALGVVMLGGGDDDVEDVAVATPAPTPAVAPTPTPSPVPTATAAPLPTPTPEATSTPAPTPTPQFDIEGQADPVGALELLEVTGTSVRIVGYALDPGVREAPIAIHVIANGIFVQAHLAQLDRPDVAAWYNMGAAHGFDLTFELAPATYELCVFAPNAPEVPDGGVSARLDCETVTI